MKCILSIYIMSYFVLRALFFAFLMSQAQPMEGLPADISSSAVNFDLEHRDDQIITRPLTENDWDLWTQLNASPLVCQHFRNGKMHTQQEIRPQFERSLERHANGDPRYLHVIQMKIDDHDAPLLHKGWIICNAR